jgi:hypothetical protein
MGQRSAIFMFLLGGAPVVAAFASVLVASLLHIADGTVLAVLFPVPSIGFALLVSAKLPLLRKGRLGSFGPAQLSSLGRVLYWSGYIVIGFGALFALQLLALH